MLRRLGILIVTLAAIGFATDASAIWWHGCDGHSSSSEDPDPGVDPDHHVDTDNDCTENCYYEVEIEKPNGSILLGYIIAIDGNGGFSAVLTCAGNTSRQCYNATFVEGSFSEGLTCHFGNPSDPGYGITELSC